MLDKNVKSVLSNAYHAPIRQMNAYHARMIILIIQPYQKAVLVK